MQMQALADAIKESAPDRDRLGSIKNRLLGDPRRAPRRIVGFIVFLLVLLLVIGTLHLLTSRAESSGSSLWIVRIVADIVGTLWFAIPLAIYAYYRLLGRRRNRYAAQAAEHIGWLTESVKHLSDAVRTTDNTSRVITTTDDELDEIKEAVDAGLKGEPHRFESVDYYGRGRSDEQPEQADETVEIATVPEDAALDKGLDGVLPEPPEEPYEMGEGDLPTDDGVDSATDADTDTEQPEEDTAEPERAVEDDLEPADERSDSDAVFGEENDRPSWAVETDETAADSRSTNDDSGPIFAPGRDDEADHRDRDHPEDVEPQRETTEDFLPVPADDRDEDGRQWQDRLAAITKRGSHRAADLTVAGLERAWTASQTGFAALKRHSKTAKERLGPRLSTALSVAWSLLAGAAAFCIGLLSSTLARFGSDRDGDADSSGPDEDIPWRIRFSEEFKHFILDLSAGYRSDDIRWRLILPAAVTMATLMLAFRIWVRPIALLLFLGFSILVGLAVFWSTKRLRSRRLSKYRDDRGAGHWDDVAGLVKTVETADVTAYIGFMGGRTYASYDREEFVDEFSVRLWQRTHNERVAPSILEQYARNLGMMKPNLQGHRENIEIPAIQRRIKEVVEQTEDEVVEKAELAYRVIEPGDETVKFEQNLGHDPRLVAQEYRWFVEEGGILSEMEIEMLTAEGEDSQLTLVYPSEKRRLPDIQQLHSRLSDRFHGVQGEPHYRLPQTDAQKHLQPFQATRSAWSELPESGPNGHTTVSNS